MDTAPGPTPDPQIVQHQPVLGPPEHPLNAPPLPEQPHDPTGAFSYEVLRAPQPLPRPGTPPHGDDRPRPEPLSRVPDVLRAVLAVSHNDLEPDAEPEGLLQQRLEVELVIIVAGSHREGDGELRARAGGGGPPVAGEEAP